ncbi:hypothetical protein EVAR_27291_1 [Eumeta japonica]|uniref:Secreted protein n=1 Tax=Eumeta variegata TaxID=151549 RepID=A0A4C1UCG5_EUMVA|nr:hypothetical protein EVAR_27291_1 [Eumeta japonica]
MIVLMIVTLITGAEQYALQIMLSGCRLAKSGGCKENNFFLSSTSFLLVERGTTWLQRVQRTPSDVKAIVMHSELWHSFASLSSKYMSVSVPAAYAV